MTTGEQIYNIKRAHDSLSVVIHNRRHLPTVIWAIGCIVVALPLICMVFAGDFLLFMIGLFMLAVVVFLCIPILNWQFTGYETVSVNNQGIRIVRMASTNEKDKFVKQSAIEEIMIMPTEHEIGYKWSWLRPATLSSFHIGKISIKQKDEITRFGSGLTDEEANDILEIIRTYQEGIVSNT